MTNTFKNPATFNKFTKSFGFLVEGSTDKNFVEDFLKKFFDEEKIDKKLFNKNTFEVKKINVEGGKSGFFKDGNIESFLPEFNKNLFNLVLIIDADAELENQQGQPAGFKDVKEEIEKIISEINKKEAYQEVKILYYIMPFHDYSEFGQLEDLFIKSLNSKYRKKLDECLKTYQKCLEKEEPKPEIKENKMPKVQMEILLKSFNKDLSKDNLTEWIDYNHESLNNFKKFLIDEVFKIKSSK